MAFDDNSDWMDKFHKKADEILGNESGCDQVHPIIEAWYERWLNSENPAANRSAIGQALACLATETLNQIPPDIVKVLIEQSDEDEVLSWLQFVLLTGQKFQQALDRGELDDL